jgi:hypothetical protein
MSLMINNPQASPRTTGGGSGTIFSGTWDASSNTPTIVSGVGTKGTYFIVNIPGATVIDGNGPWNVGDWIVFNGTVWQQIPGANVVFSVFGRTGDVIAVGGDYNASLITNDTSVGGSTLQDAINLTSATDFDNGNSGAAATIDWNQGTIQKITLTGTPNCTLTWSNNAVGRRIILEIVQGAGGNKTITYPATVKWEDGIIPTLSTTAGKIDVIAFWSDGTNEFAQIYGKNY